MVNFVERVDDFVRIRRVLVSVSDKSGLDQLIPDCSTSTPIPNSTRRGDLSGVSQLLGSRALRCLTSVAEYTGQPETQGGW